MNTEIDFVPETSPAIVVKDRIVRSGLSSDELREKSQELVCDIKKNYLELAMYLYEAYIDNKFKSWGYDSFKQYAQQELGIKYGKASYLKNIWLHFGNNDKLLDKMKTVGWDKMKELTRVVTEENVEEWVGKAKLLSADDLKKEVKSALKILVPNDSQDALANEEKVRGTPVEDEIFSQTFQFHYDSKLAVIGAIEKVQKETGVSASEALALICSDYMGSAGGAEGVQHVLEVIKRYESSMGLKFVVVDPMGTSLLHGKDILEILVKSALEG